MVRPDGVLGSLQPVPALLEGRVDGQKFPVTQGRSNYFWERVRGAFECFFFFFTFSVKPFVSCFFQQIFVKERQCKRQINGRSLGQNNSILGVHVGAQYSLTIQNMFARQT